MYIVFLDGPIDPPVENATAKHMDMSTVWQHYYDRPNEARQEGFFWVSRQSLTCPIYIDHGVRAAEAVYRAWQYAHSTQASSALWHLRYGWSEAWMFRQSTWPRSSVMPPQHTAQFKQHELTKGIPSVSLKQCLKSRQVSSMASACAPLSSSPSSSSSSVTLIYHSCQSTNHLVVVCLTARILFDWLRFHHFSTTSLDPSKHSSFNELD
jgi:hypothetical protein